MHFDMFTYYLSEPSDKLFYARLSYAQMHLSQ